MRIAVLDDYLHLATRLADWSAVQQRATVEIFDRHLDEDEAARVLAGFDALCHVRERTAMPRSLIERLPNLKFMAITGRSHRTMDMAAVKERGIVVSCTNNGEAGKYGTSELAWGLILALARYIAQSAAAMKRGGWQTQVGYTLNGKTLGLIGLGRLGQSMVPIARAFGMQVIAWSSNLTPEAAAAAGATWVTKDELLRSSDFISLHLVLGDRSRNTLTGRDFALMKPSAFLVNTARAGLVDTAAMMTALSERRIAGAGIDVFDHEPLDDDHPLRRLDNVVLTPHLGYTVEETLQTFYQGTVASLLAYMDGQPINVVSG